MKAEINTQLSTSKQNIFFTSDTHFYHYNILKYCKRPFKDIDDMNEKLIYNWNKKVKKKDIVFHLGDFAFTNIENTENLLNRLNGKIYLIKGNHDRKLLKTSIVDKFEYVTQQLYINVDGQKIYLCHFPFLTFDGIYRKNPTWQLFGHVHSNKDIKTNEDSGRLKYLLPYQYDVGVDNNNYTPISFAEVREIIKKQSRHKNNKFITWIKKILHLY